MKIEINNEMIGDIVVESLTDLLESFEDDIREVIATGEDVNFASDDVVVELSELMKNRDALKKVLSLYVV